MMFWYSSGLFPQKWNPLKIPDALILPGVLTRDCVKSIAAAVEVNRKPNFPRQTGFSLTGIDFSGRLEVLESLVSKKAGVSLKLRQDMSSCRTQPPDGKGALALHQDTAALGVDPTQVPCCVIWLPLCDIDESTPTLEVALGSPRQALQHISDENLYAVLPPGSGIDPPLATLSHMKMGDAMLMAATTLHRTCARPWHTKQRISLDLRYLPQFAPLRFDLPSVLDSLVRGYRTQVWKMGQR